MTRELDLQMLGYLCLLFPGESRLEKRPHQLSGQENSIQRIGSADVEVQRQEEPVVVKKMCILQAEQRFPPHKVWLSKLVC